MAGTISSKGTNRRRESAGGNGLEKDASAGSTALQIRDPSTKKEDDEEDFDYVDKLFRVDLSKDLDSKFLFAKPQFRLPILKAYNYCTWSAAHENFFKYKGMMGWLTGKTEMPKTKIQARRWYEIDGYIAVLLVANVEERRQRQLDRLESAHDIWKELKKIELTRIRGPSGQRRLVALTKKFFGYTKSRKQSILEMSLDLRKIRNEIQYLSPEFVLPEQVLALFILNACKGPEWDTIKMIIQMKTDEITPEMVVDRLRGAEDMMMLEKERRSRK